MLSVHNFTHYFVDKLAWSRKRVDDSNIRRGFISTHLHNDPGNLLSEQHT